MASFAASVGSWASATEERLDAVHKRALEKLAMEMTRTKAEGGNVPVDTGNLYRSLVASTSGLPRTGDGPFTGSNATAVIAQLQIDQTLWFGYQARYARSQNYFYNNLFVERAVAMWPQLVDEAVREVRSNAIG